MQTINTVWISYSHAIGIMYRLLKRSAGVSVWQGRQEGDRDSSQGTRICTQHLSYSVSLPDTVGKSESQMVKITRERRLLFMATALFCDGRQKC